MKESYTEEHMPEWAHREIRHLQRTLRRFNEAFDLYRSESNCRIKIEMLRALCAKFSEIKGIVSRYSFFAKASGFLEVESEIKNEAKVFERWGVKIKIPEEPKIINVLFLDTETTGLRDDDEPISVGAILAEVSLTDGLIVREIFSYYGLQEPSCDISDGAHKVHGITKQQLFGKKFDITELVYMFGTSALIVAHNASFDRKMMRFMKNKEKPWGCSCWEVEWPEKAGGRSLNSICDFFGIKRTPIHNALTDTLAMICALEMRRPDGSTYLSDVLTKHKHFL